MSWLNYFILVSFCRIFYQLILKHIHLAGMKRNSNGNVGSSRFSSERIDIPVRKYDPEVFRMLIEFVHSGVVTVTMETVAGMCSFYVPNTYKLRILYI